LHFDRADLRQVRRSGNKLDDYLIVRHIHWEGLVDRLECTSSRRDDIEIFQDLSSINRDIKDALISGRVINLGKLQNNITSSVRNTQGVGKAAISFGLVQRGIGRIRYCAGCAGRVPASKAVIRKPELPR